MLASTVIGQKIVKQVSETKFHGTHINNTSKKLSCAIGILN